jgi:hypothetical protein
MLEFLDTGDFWAGERQWLPSAVLDVVPWFLVSSGIHAPFWTGNEVIRRKVRYTRTGGTG